MRYATEPAGSARVVICPVSVFSTVSCTSVVEVPSGLVMVVFTTVTLFGPRKVVVELTDFPVIAGRGRAAVPKESELLREPPKGEEKKGSLKAPKVSLEDCEAVRNPRGGSAKADEREEEKTLGLLKKSSSKADVRDLEKKDSNGSWSPERYSEGKVDE